jgi:hypothetical protein
MVRVPLIAALAGVLIIGSGCDDAPRGAAPSPMPAAPEPTVPARPLPPLTGPGITYAFTEAVANAYGLRSSQYTVGSTFVLYESGVFSLRFVTVDYEVRGRYERVNGQVHFHFSERSPAADAIGTLRDNLMEVRYSEIMLHSDYEDAVYQMIE